MAAARVEVKAPDLCGRQCGYIGRVQHDLIG